MPRRNFLLSLAYDGTDFLGWQRLPAQGRSVQAAVEEALGRVIGQSIEVTGAGRTDAGVHAEGQAASFHAHTDLGCEALKVSLNREFPGDLVCRSCGEVDPRFHARYRAKAKVYRYRLHLGPEPDPFVRRYSLHVDDRLDREAMARAGRSFVGEHDFRAFTNARAGDTVRRLDEVRVEERPPFIDLCFVGRGFLYNQVRIMAGALLEAGRGRLSPARLETLLAGAPRAAAPDMLGAFGLCLVEVRFA